MIRHLQKGRRLIYQMALLFDPADLFALKILPARHLAFLGRPVLHLGFVAGRLFRHPA